MKNVIICLGIILSLFSCSKRNFDNYVTKTEYNKIVIENNLNKELLKEAKDSIQVLQDSIYSSIGVWDKEYKTALDSITYYKQLAKDKDAESLIYKFQIERIRNYIKIVDKDKTQLQFLKGWIKRAIEDEF